jgi:hypothetical protein
MTKSDGFTKTQINELSRMFENVVDTIDETIKASEKLLIEQFDPQFSQLDSRIDKLEEKLDNYVTTTPTKYQVDNHEKRITRLESITLSPAI